MGNELVHTPMIANIVPSKVALNLTQHSVRLFSWQWSCISNAHSILSRPYLESSSALAFSRFDVEIAAHCLQQKVIVKHITSAAQVKAS